MRTWMQVVEGMGQLVRVDGASWDLEMGAVADVVFRESPLRPCVLFDNVPGYPAGFRVLVNLLGTLERQALTMGLAHTTSAVEFTDRLRRKLDAPSSIPPLVVADGPVLEHVQRGDDIDLWKFPVPRWNTLDGGRYLGTGSVVLMRDPDTGWVNAGTYRVQVHDRDQLTVYISPGKHGRIIRDKYFALGKPAPVAISFGHDPLLFWVSCQKVPWGKSELDLAGALRGEPVHVVEGPLTGLPIPAGSEIVIEGEMYPDRMITEGPFGEFTGYYASSSRPEPLVQVRAVYHRTDPIICGVPTGMPPTDNTFTSQYAAPALLWNTLERSGVIDVRGVARLESTMSFITVVSIQQRFAGHAKQALLAAAQAGAYLGRFIVVVDDDIDPTDTNEVLWAMGTRVDPERDIEIVKRTASGPLDPIVPADRKGFASLALIDATRPWEWLKDFPPTVSVPAELRQRVIDRWGDRLGVPRAARSGGA
jgi:UbiD family decarboxylase